MRSKRSEGYVAVENAPPDRIAEFVEGALHLSPRPGPKHAAAATAIAGTLHDPWHKGKSGPGGWWILLEPEVHAADDIVVPDVAGWRRERMETLPDTAWFTTAPDWVCEVLSASTARLDRELKTRVYAEAGVEFLWLADPAKHLLEVYRREARNWNRLFTVSGDALVAVPPFEEVPFELKWFWN